MAKRSGQPALYEMMRNRGVTPVLPPERTRAVEDVEVMRDEPTPSPWLERLRQMLTPGRTLEVPVGFLLLGLGLLIGVLMLIYAIGFSSGKSRARTDFEEKFGVAPVITGSVNDPLTSLASGDRSSPVSLEVQPPSAQPPGQSGSGVPVAKWGPVVPRSDPRQKGWNYFIAAENTLARCQALAEFCRVNGLETYVVPHKNGGRVIVFPGYQGPRDAPEVKALEERIHQIGDKYKLANKYETNMRDAYPAKYDG